MAKKQGKRKKTRLEVVDEKLEKFFEILFWPVFQVLKIVFRIIAFIFWRNKYSKRYWDKRREWIKTKRKLRSKTQKEIILSIMIPLLEKHDFQLLPEVSRWGWNKTLQGYDYTLGRLRGNELQKFEIYTQYGYRYFIFRIEVFILKPMVKDIAELLAYDPFMFFPESNYPCVINQFTIYKFKNFRSKKGLKKKTEKLIRRIETDFSNIDALYLKWRKNITPVIIDLMQKKKDREKEV